MENHDDPDKALKATVNDGQRLTVLVRDSVVPSVIHTETKASVLFLD